MNDLLDLSTGAVGPAWPAIILAAVLAGDALLSIRPPAFIRDCLSGIQLPRDWWWTLIVVKLLAAAGLLLGIHYPGIGFAASVGVIAYFVCAAVAHIRAQFTGVTFWLNCLGMLAASVLVFGVTYGPALGNTGDRPPVTANTGSLDTGRKCDEVWSVGKVLPRNYKRCVSFENEVAAQRQIECASGQPLYVYHRELVAIPGHLIQPAGSKAHNVQACVPDVP